MEVEFGVRLPAKYRSMVGSVDVDCPPSKYPCVGCGAPIHCCSPQQPGFISSAKFHVRKFSSTDRCILWKRQFQFYLIKSNHSIHYHFLLYNCYYLPIIISLFLISLLFCSCIYRL